MDSASSHGKEIAIHVLTVEDMGDLIQGSITDFHHIYDYNNHLSMGRVQLSREYANLTYLWFKSRDRS